MDFHSISRTKVRGVSNSVTKAESRGTVKVESNVNGKTYHTTLQNILYISTNQHSLLALGRWDKYGGTIKVAQGHLSLIDKNGKTRATGKRLDSNLYQMNVRVRKSGTQSSPQMYKIFPMLSEQLLTLGRPGIVDLNT